MPALLFNKVELLQHLALYLALGDDFTRVVFWIRFDIRDVFQERITQTDRLPVSIQRGGRGPVRFEGSDSSTRY